MHDGLDYGAKALKESSKTDRIETELISLPAFTAAFLAGCCLWKFGAGGISAIWRSDVRRQGTPRPYFSAPLPCCVIIIFLRAYPTLLCPFFSANLLRLYFILQLPFYALFYFAPASEVKQE